MLRIDPFRPLAAELGGWANQRQKAALEHLREENRPYRPCSDATPKTAKFTLLGCGGSVSSVPDGAEQKKP
jgi:hypothetical protein